MIVDYQKSIGNTAIEGYDAGPNAHHAAGCLDSIINATAWFDSLR